MSYTAISSHPDGSDEARTGKVRRRTALSVGAAVMFLALWLYLLYAAGALQDGPGGKAFGEDFDVYLAAAHIMQNGGNPYDNQLLYRTEAALLHQQGLKVVEPRALVRIGNPPFFPFALRPLTALPFRLAVTLWVLFTSLVALTGFLGALRYFAWRRRVLPCLLFLAMPPVVQGALYGEVTGLYFGAIGVALGLCRKYPVAAGALLSIAWLKPTMALPLALLVALFYSSDRMRTMAGFAGASAALLILTLATTGWGSVDQWVHALFGFSSSLHTQPGLTSLTGFYVNWAPGPVKLVLEVFTVGAALTVTFIVLVRTVHASVPALGLAWLWPMWMLATPYAHFPDEMALAIPIVALMGTDAFQIGRGRQLIVLYLMTFSLWLTPWHPSNVQLAPLVPLALLVCLVDTARKTAVFRSFTHAVVLRRTPFPVKVCPFEE